MIMSAHFVFSHIAVMNEIFSYLNYISTYFKAPLLANPRSDFSHVTTFLTIKNYVMLKLLFSSYRSIYIMDVLFDLHYLSIPTCIANVDTVLFPLTHDESPFMHCVRYPYETYLYNNTFPVLSTKVYVP